MSDDKKWKLSSGTIVEDILFDICKYDKDELLAHSWVIDLDNKETEAMFNANDWQEITDAIRPPPKVCEMFVKYLANFAEVSWYNRWCLLSSFFFFVILFIFYLFLLFIFIYSNFIFYDLNLSGRYM